MNILGLSSPCITQILVFLDLSYLTICHDSHTLNDSNRSTLRVQRMHRGNLSGKMQELRVETLRAAHAEAQMPIQVVRDGWSSDALRTQPQSFLKSSRTARKFFPFSG